MKTKDHSVKLDKMHPEMWPMALRVDRVYREVTGDESTITSGCEVVIKPNGKLIHKKTSLHYPHNCPYYKARALDFRTWTSSTSGIQLAGLNRRELVNKVKDAVGPAFQVIDEKNHIHIELDG